MAIEIENEDTESYINNTQYDLDTGDKGISSIETSILKGKLDSIIFESKIKVDLIIESSLGYLILKRNQIEGVNYLAPRVRIVPSEDDMRDILTFEKFNLDENLIISVIGPTNTAVKLIIRAD